MGGDFAPDVTVDGALLARRTYQVACILVGDRDQLTARLYALGEDPAAWRIEHAPAIVGMGDHPVAALRAKRDSSIHRAADLVAAGTAQAFVSIGSTGAAMAAGVLIVGRAPGVDRPGLAALLPSTGRPALVIDVGANVDAKASHLLDFAVMGRLYQQRIMGVEDPRIGVLSIGAEESKGNALVLETSELLRARGWPYAGHLEPEAVLRGAADVVVCDGFAGNLLIKAMEATAEFAFDRLRLAVRQSLRAKLGALVLRPALRQVRRAADYSVWGGVPLLGVNGIVIIGHGRSRAPAVANALRVAERAVRMRLVPTIAEGLQTASGRP